MYIQSYEAASIVSIKGYSVTKAFWYKVRIPTSPRFCLYLGGSGLAGPSMHLRGVLQRGVIAEFSTTYQKYGLGFRV